MARSITAVTLILVVACGGRNNLNPLGGGPSLSFSQYNSLEEGTTAEAVLRAFGKPLDTLEKDGSVRGLTYRCKNSAGQVLRLRMVFDEAQKLENWVLVRADVKKSTP